MDAVTFILEHEYDPKKYLEATIDLSFANGDWLRTVQKRRRGKDCFIRQHLETCVLTYVATELKTGDLCICGSEQFADYRDQLLSWEVCEPHMADCGLKPGFEASAQGFVAHLKQWLTEVAEEVDRTKPENHELVITEKGEPVLKKPVRKTVPMALFPGGNICEDGAHHPTIVGCYLFGRVGSLLLQPPGNRIDKQSRNLGWYKAVLYDPRGDSLLTSQTFEHVSQALLHHPSKIGA